MTTQEYNKSYYDNNKERLSEQRREYRIRNKQQLSGYDREYKRKNREDRKEKRRLWLLTPEGQEYKLKESKAYHQKLKTERPFTKMWRSMNGSAKKRGLEVTIEEKDLQNQWDKQNGLCYYTGKPMSMNFGDRPPDLVSIERLDNSIGYTPSNIVLCRWVINRMRSNLTQVEFSNLINEIYTHLSH